MRAISHPDTDTLHLATVFNALSDPVRLEIVWRLADGEVSCGRLEVGVSKSTLTHHLKVLRDAGITRTRSAGVSRFVSLREQDLELRFPGLLELVMSHRSEAARPRAAGALAAGAV
ncbi:MAG TPA: metalloregulator ArsR/SmtB family transcription factor [Solirubrobacteraceae bacterium]|nr:metalloregulator ArsR/SmtB family transcription factor [Solirubrobacteraceae bacterium]